MKNISKIIAILILFLGMNGCYEDFVSDFDYSAVCFGAQKPARTLVTRESLNELEFKMGIALSGVRENTTGYSAEYMFVPDLLTDMLDAVEKDLRLLPADCYRIGDTNNPFTEGTLYTMEIPKGKIIGDFPIKINKDKFIALEGSLTNRYALPFKLISTTADKIIDGKDYTIIVVKWVDEHSGDYWYRGWQAEWDPGSSSIVDGTTIEYAHADWSKEKERRLTTLSLTRFNMAGFGTIATNDVAANLAIRLENGIVTLQRRTSMYPVEDLGSTYDPEAKIFTLKYIYTVLEKDSEGNVIEGMEKGRFLVNETLKLRQDVEKELRFEAWLEDVEGGEDDDE